MAFALSELIHLLGNRASTLLKPVQDYPQLSLRLPAEVKATLQALSLFEARPQWRVIADAIEAYARSRSDAERRLIAELAGRSTARARSVRRG